MRPIRATIVAVEKQKTIRITYCECVFVALFIHRAMRMRRIILASVACPAVQYFSTLLQTALFCNKKYIHTKYVLTLRRLMSYIYIYIWSTHS